MDALEGEVNARSGGGAGDLVARAEALLRQQQMVRRLAHAKDTAAMYGFDGGAAFRAPIWPLQPECREYLNVPTSVIQP